MAAYGGSAGAGITLWLAFKDDMADPNSDDPWPGSPPGCACGATFGGQSTYDPHVIKAWIGEPAARHPVFNTAYNVKCYEELDNPKLQKIYDEVSAIKHLTADDPPIFEVYSESNVPLTPNAQIGQGMHHPIFGLKLKEAMDKLDIECVYMHTVESDGDPNLEMVKFFRRHFRHATGAVAERAPRGRQNPPHAIALCNPTPCKMQGCGGETRSGGGLSPGKRFSLCRKTYGEIAAPLHVAGTPSALRTAATGCVGDCPGTSEQHKEQKNHDDDDIIGPDPGSWQRSRGPLATGMRPSSCWFNRAASWAPAYCCTLWAPPLGIAVRWAAAGPVVGRPESFRCGQGRARCRRAG